MADMIDSHRRMADGKIIQGSSYTSIVLNHKERHKIIIKAFCNLKRITDDFDSIACCGTSGLLVAPQVAELLDKHIVVIRKRRSSEPCYSPYRVEGVMPFRYVILDDLICSGETVRYIKKNIHDEIPRAKCVGVYCYMPDQCAYHATNEGSKLCQRDLGIPLLNLSGVRT